MLGETESKQKYPRTSFFMADIGAVGFQRTPVYVFTTVKLGMYNKYSPCKPLLKTGVETFRCTNTMSPNGNYYSKRKTPRYWDPSSTIGGSVKQ